jgi:hypothetical protein
MPPVAGKKPQPPAVAPTNKKLMIADDPAANRLPVLVLFESETRIKLALEQLKAVGVHPSDAVRISLQETIGQLSTLRETYHNAYLETLKR